MTGHKLAICRRCRHVFFDEDISEDILREYYLREYTDAHGQLELQEQNRSYYASHAADIAARCRYRRLPLSVIDFGSSFPVFSYEAARAGFANSVAVEVSDASRKWGLENGISVQSPEEAFEEREQYGVARFSHCLEHLIDPAGFLKRVARILVPNGLIYITQPTFPVCRSNGQAPLYKDSVFPEHLHFFNPLSLKIALERAGFRILQVWAAGNEGGVGQLFGSVFDSTLAIRRLWRLSHKRPPRISRLGGWPVYLGENISCWAVHERSSYFGT